MEEHDEEKCSPPKTNRKRSAQDTSKRSSKRKRASHDDAYKSSEDYSFSSSDEPFTVGTARPKKLSAGQRKAAVKEVCCHQHVDC